MRLCTICARGGSRGVPGKNLRLLGGRPLIAHSFLHAKESKLFSHIAISSDSEEILAVGREHGADFIIKRPAELASDEAGKLPAIVHAAKEAESFAGKRYDVVVDLDVTAPLRIGEDIQNAVSLLEKTGASCVISGTPSRHSPYFNLVECDENNVVRQSKSSALVRRQDSPECYDLNGSVYVWKRDRLIADPKVFYDDTQLYVMPRERSVDIDDELDFSFVEYLFAKRRA